MGAGALISFRLLFFKYKKCFYFFCFLKCVIKQNIFVLSHQFIPQSAYIPVCLIVYAGSDLSLNMKLKVQWNNICELLNTLDEIILKLQSVMKMNLHGRFLLSILYLSKADKIVEL